MQVIQKLFKEVDTNSRKLELLKDSLTGPARTLVIDLDISDENYAKCWQILDKEYGNDLETRAQLIDQI